MISPPQFGGLSRQRVWQIERKALARLLVQAGPGQTEPQEVQ